MSKRGAPGLGVQVSKCLKTIRGRGISKHETKQEYIAQAKARGERINPLKSPLIHSDKYYQNIHQTSVQFLRWSREQGYGARYIKDFKFKEAGRKWFEERISKGIKDLRTEAAHLDKLQSAIEKTWAVKTEIVPKDLGKQLRAAGYPTTKEGRIAQQTTYRRYTNEEVQKGLSHVRGQRAGGMGKADALEAQHSLGLRVREAASLRAWHVDLERGHVYVCEGQKGTRTRFVPIPVEYRSKLSDLVQGKDRNDRVFNVRGKSIDNRVRNLERAWERAMHAQDIQEHRTHNLRAAYACNRLEGLKDKGMSKEDAERVLIEELGHSDTSKLQHYIR